MDLEVRRTQAPTRVADIVSVSLTALLLLIRLADSSLTVWLFGASPPAWVPDWYAGCLWILMVALVILHRGDLSALNIDRGFMLILLVSGVMLFSIIPERTGLALGLAVGVTTAGLAWYYFTNRTRFTRPIDTRLGSWILVPISALTLVPPFVVGLLRHGTVQPLTQGTILQAFFGANLFGIAFEEFLIRGMLWHYLERIGLKAGSIMLVQGLVFWLAHHSQLASGGGYGFWLSEPLIALLFGFIVWRSRSVTLSSSSHLIYNFAVCLLQIAF